MTVVADVSSWRRGLLARRKKRTGQDYPGKRVVSAASGVYRPYLLLK